MSRDSWNPDSPIALGQQFLGVGTVGYSYPATPSTWRGLVFTAQATEDIDEILFYTGGSTSVPLAGSIFAGHRVPYMVELVTLDDVLTGVTNHTITRYRSVIESVVNMVDNGTGGAFNPLALTAVAPPDIRATAANGSATCYFIDDIDTFPLDRQVLSLAIEANTFAPNWRADRRGDRNFAGSATLWSRIMAGGGVTYHLGERWVEDQDTALWHEVTPQMIRQFAQSGNRRIRLAVQTFHANYVYNYMAIHVDHVPERRIGVGTLEVPVLGSQIDEIISVPVHAPAATGTPVSLTAGEKYVLIVRGPYGSADYTQPANLDLRSLRDYRPPTGGFQHFEGLEWDHHTINVNTNNQPVALGALLDGLPAVQMLDSSVVTVESQPYVRVVGARVYNGQDAVQVNIDNPAPSTEYNSVRLFVSTADDPSAPLQVTFAPTATGSPIVGPFEVTAAEVDALPGTGNTDEAGRVYKAVTIPFDMGYSLPDPFAMQLSSSGPVSAHWIVATTRAPAVTGGDQTFDGTGSFAQGEALDFVEGEVTPLSDGVNYRDDIEFVMFTQAPEVSGLGVETITEQVNGATCAHIVTGAPECQTCVAPELNFARVCWSPSTLDPADFGAFELQRSDDLGSTWKTIFTTTENGLPAQGEADTQINTQFPAIPSVESTTDTGLLFGFWMCDVVVNFTAPPGFFPGIEVDAAGSTSFDAVTPVDEIGPTAPAQATSSGSSGDDYVTAATVIRGRGGYPVLEQHVASSVVGTSTLTLNTAGGTQAGWWLVVIQGVDLIGSATGDTMVKPLDSAEWQLVSDSGPPASPGDPRVKVWVRQVITPGDQAVQLQGHASQFESNHGHLYVLSNTAPICYDDWDAPWDRELRYRIRQQRNDGSFSDWSPPVSHTIASSPGSGGDFDIAFIVPDDPSLNAAYPEAHDRSPIQHEFQLLDAEQVTHNSVYGRDYQLAFRPLEKLGVEFDRNILVSPLCPATAPCLDIVQPLRDIMTAQVPFIIVKDRCGNQWYASLQVPVVSQFSVAGIENDVWIATARIVQLVDPIIEGLT